jgi:hypothetical protein
MVKSVDAQRRKLLDEIERLAEIAIFGTLSETYRTCGRAGCHCQGDGPKHGPHLNVSYCGEKGKTTGYYVPKSGGSHAPWRRRLASNAAMFARAGGVKQRSQFAACPRGGFAMKLWFRLILVWGAWVGLLLGLTQVVGLNLRATGTDGAFAELPLQLGNSKQRHRSFPRKITGPTDPI